MKIAILDDYQDCVRHLDCFALLREHGVTVFNHPARGSGQLAIRLARFDAIVLIGTGTALPAGLLRKLPNLQYIAQIGPLGEHLDAAAATALNIAVYQGVGDAVAPAELTWGLIMAAARHIPAYANHLREGVWQMVSTEAHANRPGRRLRDRRLAIWGYGRVGKLVAGYGKAFGMRVQIWGSSVSLDAAASDGFETAGSRQAMFEQADVLTLHLRLNAATRGIISAADLASMQATALLVNTSHAALIAPGALEQALDRGRPGAAALDVFESEPVAAQSTLLARANVLATPHIGALEIQGYEETFRAAFENLLGFAAGRASGLNDPDTARGSA